MLTSVIIKWKRDLMSPMNKLLCLLGASLIMFGLGKAWGQPGQNPIFLKHRCNTQNSCTDTSGAFHSGETIDGVPVYNCVLENATLQYFVCGPSSSIMDECINNTQSLCTGVQANNHDRVCYVRRDSCNQLIRFALYSKFIDIQDAAKHWVAFDL